MSSCASKLLVLDLDETLVHAGDGLPPREPDFWTGPYWVIKRPGLGSFLRDSFELFAVGVWTASSEDYAADVASHIFVDVGRLAFLWSRRRCTLRSDPERRETYWLKDLKKLKRRGYGLENIIVVDDDRRNLSRQYGNLICIDGYRGDAEDNKLPMLLKFLSGLAHVPDVRTVEKRGWERTTGRDFP